MFDRIADFLAMGLYYWIKFWVNVVDTVIGLWDEFADELQARYQYLFLAYYKFPYDRWGPGFWS